MSLSPLLQSLAPKAGFLAQSSNLRCQEVIPDSCPTSFFSGPAAGRPLKAALSSPAPRLRPAPASAAVPIPLTNLHVLVNGGDSISLSLCSRPWRRCPLAARFLHSRSNWSRVRQLEPMSSPRLGPCTGPGQLLADSGHLGSENLGLN